MMVDVSPSLFSFQIDILKQTQLRNHYSPPMLNKALEQKTCLAVHGKVGGEELAPLSLKTKCIMANGGIRNRNLLK